MARRIVTSNAQPTLRSVKTHCLRSVKACCEKHRRRLRKSGAPTMQTWNSVCGDTRREPDQPQARGYHGRNATQAFPVRLAKELRQPCPAPREGLRTQIDVRREVGGEKGANPTQGIDRASHFSARMRRDFVEIHHPAEKGLPQRCSPGFMRRWAVAAAGTVSFRAPTLPVPAVPDPPGRGRRGWCAPRRGVRRPCRPRTSARF